MNWGKSIILSFVLFAIFIGVLATVCIKEDISLVSKNYYQEEMAFQDQIVRMNNANNLAEKPVIRLSGGALEIEFNQFSEIEKGELRIFRPSNAQLDKLLVLKASSQSIQRFDVGSLPKGMYRAKMLWSMAGKEYFVESQITL